MSRRTKVAFFLGLLAIACGRPNSTSAEEIDKKPIIEQWRKEIQPLKAAYANVQISGSQMVDKKL